MKKIIYSMLVATLTAFTFASCEDVPAPYTDPNSTHEEDVEEVETAQGDGTEANPFNPVAANEKAATLASGETTTDSYYIKGIVSSVKECSAQYGNATFYLTSDGTDGKTSFFVFQTKGLGNKSISSDDEVNAGDTIIVVGKLTNFNGTYETAKNTSYIVYQNGNTSGGSSSDTKGQATGDGTEANPYNSVAANNIASALASGAESDQFYYIKGKVVSIKSAYSASYGNGSFYISDDGTSANQFLVYRALYLNNEKYQEGQTQVEVGDDVVICAKLTNYMGNTPETVQGSCYLVSLKSNGQGGSDEGDDVTAAGLTIKDNYVYLVNGSATASAESITADASSFGVADEAASGEAITSVTLSDGTTLTFDGNGETNAPKYFSKYSHVRMYKNNILTIKGKKPIAKVVLTCDSNSSTIYVGNTTATINFSGNDAVYTNVFTGSTGGGVQIRFKSIKIVYAQ